MAALLSSILSQVSSLSPNPGPVPQYRALGGYAHALSRPQPELEGGCGDPECLGAGYPQGFLCGLRHSQVQHPLQSCLLPAIWAASKFQDGDLTLYQSKAILCHLGRSFGES
ncbi:hypothetical protein HispidOSU_005891 [Sigmodon hispidus]